ncbi:hypothetical protein AN960_16790 [Bacillus sp. FJAT-25509]|uniref:hypothetical protein n=1 Tax=Bacillaceae TaxID=186817 RepID=UPI0006F95BB3|nr:hypothetical protein [Bacillus sp. FJAT-25509]KQL36275.1 hypothetical protein AN960_16790 [Bacillus sp. FJAT-25509]
MIQSIVLRRLGGTLNEILELIERSAQVSELHAEFATGNRLVTYIEFGQLEYLDQYLAWYEGRDYIFMGLPFMLEGFVKLGRLEDNTCRYQSSKNY